MADPSALERDFALFAQLRQSHTESDDDLTQAEQLDAEARWLLAVYIQRQSGSSTMPTWTDVQRLKSAHLRTQSSSVPHRCARSTCSHMYAPQRGQQFLDPKTARRCVSTGDVYLCCTTGAVHVCGESCDYETLEDNALYVCSVSGRCRGVNISSEETFREREDRLGISSNGAPLGRQHLSRAGGGSRKRAHSTTARKPAAKRETTASYSNKTDIKQVVGTLVCDGRLLEQLERQIAERDDSIVTELRNTAARGQPLPDAAQVLDMINRRYGVLLPSAFRLRAARRAMPNGTLPTPLRIYLHDAVGTLFSLLRETEHGRSPSSKDINLRSMCVPLLYVLWQGLVGYVIYDVHSGLMLDRRVVTVDKQVPALATDRALRRERYEFVPKHPWLAALLPDEQALPETQESHRDTGNLMKRMRRIHQCFLSTLGVSSIRPEQFYLRSVLAEPS